ncbi:MAG: polyhydroxyalkanoic acid synthase [Burkholderiaceae bacterium]|nr:polyhydroxyalkanoic acid synthase [Burkholderiaceae bacterium]
MPESNAAPSYPALDIPLKSTIARFTHGISPAAVTAAMLDWWTHLAVSPGKQLALTESAWNKWLRLMMAMQECAAGQASSCVPAAAHDKRFDHPAWRDEPFHLASQAFLLWEQWWQEAATGVRGVSAHDEQVASFVMRQMTDVLSPSNQVSGNPEVLQATLAAGGQNLLHGAANWWRDYMAVLTDGRPKDAEKFTPGATVAVTPGKVVLRNRLIELIQYAPTTPHVHPEPVLIVPSWIMKYYILDLSPRNSLVKYLVDRGHTVFMISWRNPGPDDRELAMEDYVQQGVMAALRAVQQAMPREHSRGHVHAMGYCLGGTLLTMAAAALARDGRSPLATMTLLAAQTDFEEPGELGLFIDESQIAFLEDVMAERGYLDGRQMAGAFALINSKDLVWSKLVHEYLMGAQTPLNDLRAWNADATRMPARMHGEYLRRLYLHNELAEGSFVVGGAPVVLRDIRVPTYVVATERDHVSPWRSVFKIHRLSDAPLRFVLSSGGHNVGIVNPPDGPAASKSASFRVAERSVRNNHAEPQAWADAAEQHAGSWWPDWAAWLAAHSTRKVTPPPFGGKGTKRLPVLDNAPGRYVHET